MTVTLTAGNDILDTIIRIEYDVNGVPAESPPGNFLNLRGQTADGAAGIDTVTSDQPYGKYFTLTSTDTGILTMTTSSGVAKFKNFEKFSWSDGTTINLGTSSNNTIVGGKLSDKFLYGLAGNDTISGGAGDDLINGGTGKDTLTGGVGNDTFDFNSIKETTKSNTTADIIKDFATHVGSARHDQIDLKGIDAISSSAADNGFVWDGTKALTAKAGHLNYKQYNLAGTANDYTLVSGETNGVAGADFVIHLSGLKTLSALDFVL